MRGTDLRYENIEAHTILNASSPIIKPSSARAVPQHPRQEASIGGCCWGALGGTLQRVLWQNSVWISYSVANQLPYYAQVLWRTERGGVGSSRDHTPYHIHPVKSDIHIRAGGVFRAGQL